VPTAWIRTGDLPLTRRLLYQLSYAGAQLGAACGSMIVGLVGFEPTTSCIQGRHATAAPQPAKRVRIRQWWSRSKRHGDCINAQGL
jgi:hypothetical protein